MEQATKSEIGKRLRAQRELRGYTREQLGELSGLSPRFIANVELGESGISIDSLTAFCRALCCSSDSILFGNSGDDSEWSEQTDMIKSLPIRYKPQISALLQGAAELIAKAEAKMD